VSEWVVQGGGDIVSGRMICHFWELRDVPGYKKRVLESLFLSLVVVTTHCEVNKRLRNSPTYERVCMVL
jgi:hypothetical protein